MKFWASVGFFLGCCLSALGAYFSIFGLVTIYGGIAMEIRLLGIALEVVKVYVATLLHPIYRPWFTSRKLILLRCALVVLMFITGLGTYGYLTRGYLENRTNITTKNAPQIALIDSQLANYKALKEDAGKQITAIDKSLGELKGKQALQERTRQQKARAELTKQQQQHTVELIKLEQEKIKLSTDQRKLEQELGPLRYIAELIWFVNWTDEKLGLFLTLLIMVVFDPLALLLISISHGVMSAGTKEEKAPFTIKSKDTTPENRTNSNISGVDLQKILKNNEPISALDLTKVKLP